MINRIHIFIRQFYIFALYLIPLSLIVNAPIYGQQLEESFVDQYQISNINNPTKQVDHISRGEWLKITLKPKTDSVKVGIPADVKLYINGIGFDFKTEIDHKRGEVWILMDPDSLQENQKNPWDIFYTRASQRSLGFSVGTSETYLDSRPFKLKFYELNIMWVSFQTIILLFIGFIYLAKKTNMIREITQCSTLKFPFSLSKTQFAIWSLIILSCFLVIWVITGFTPEITGSTITILGISIGTSAFGRFIEQTKNKTRIQVIKERCSKGFVTDIVSDSNGQASVFRFQNVIFTIVFLFIFIFFSINNLEFIQFTDNQLWLMGISAATYVGFKTQES